MADEVTKALKGTLADGVRGFFTSKRGIGLIIGAILMGLGAFTPIEIDPALRIQLIDGIFWLVVTFIGGTSLSDSFGKGKKAEENRAKLFELIGTGMAVAADVASDLKAKTDDGGGE